MPSFTFIATGQSLLWNNLKPVFCDVDLETAQMDVNQIESLIDEETTGILAVNLWGGVANITELERIAKKYNLVLYFDSAHGFGSRIHDQTLGGFGKLEVFSFHATKVMSTAEGGCISTNDDLIAARIRSMRSSYGIGTAVPVPVTCNGRFSEAQAAIGLLNLASLPQYIENNKKLYQRYRENISKIPGIEIIEAAAVTESNFQYLVCRLNEIEYGLTRDQLMAVLKADNVNVRRYFYPGVHRSVPFVESGVAEQGMAKLKNTDILCQEVFQLPIGAKVNLEMVDKICELLVDIHLNAESIRCKLMQLE